MPGPTVVLVHGLAGSAATTWREPGWIDLLADAGREVIAPDLPGHAGSPLAAGRTDLASFVLDLLPDEPVDAVGFSLGGRTLLTAAAAAPDRFRRLVVAGIGANLFRHDDHGAMADAIAGGDSASPVARYFLDQAAVSGTDPAAVAALLRDSGPPVTAELLASVTVPTLVVIGDRDFAGPGDPLADALPDARLVTLRNVDHFSTPKAFAAIDAALDFLDAQPG